MSATTTNSTSPTKGRTPFLGRRNVRFRVEPRVAAVVNPGRANLDIVAVTR